jgi:membrane protein implicated in regulation of membrane protease activity
VTIPAGRWGSVYIKAEGQNHELSATSSEEIPSGTQVVVTGTAGNGLVVARRGAGAQPSAAGGITG